MDTICVVHFLYYEPMMPILCTKPPSFYADKPLLYTHNIIGILIKLFFPRGGVFLNNQNNVAFVWISRMIYIPCFKFDDGVLAFLQHRLIHIFFCLQCHVFILDSLNLIVTVMAFRCSSCIFSIPFLVSLYRAIQINEDVIEIFALPMGTVKPPSSISDRGRL